MTDKYTMRPEHEARLAEYRDRWIGHAMRTTPMTDAERDLCREAAIEMYRRAGLPAPRVVFVQSPLIAAMTTGCASWIWHTRTATYAATDDATDAATRAATYAATSAATSAATDAATYDATDAATRAATYAATSAATDAATYDATDAATRAATDDATIAATVDATYDATDDATDAATDAATYDATDDATDAATDAATYDATSAATDAATRAADLSRWFVATVDVRRTCSSIAGDGGVMCTSMAYRMRQGGNQWAAWPAMAEWFREVAQLPIDWSAWMPWVALAEHSGPRYVHAEFCVISDFPEVLRVDNENRPHCATGPFCRWADGFALYAWHGIRVPAWIIEQPETITVEKIDGETNAEIRRVMIDRFGFARYLAAKGASVVHEDIDEGGQPMRLYAMPSDDDDGRPMHALHVANSTADPDGSRREYVLRVPPTVHDVWAARNWTFNLPPDARFDHVS